MVPARVAVAIVVIAGLYVLSVRVEINNVLNLCWNSFKRAAMAPVLGAVVTAATDAL